MTPDVDGLYATRRMRRGRRRKRRVLPQLSVAVLECGNRPPSNQKATP
jgi:hypothetical protein